MDQQATGAAFVVRDTRVLRSGDDGIEATETSTVRILGTCEVRRNSDAGISITRGSSGLFLADMLRRPIAWGITVLGHSEHGAGWQISTILAEENTVDGAVAADTSDSDSMAARSLSPQELRRGSPSVGRKSHTFCWDDST